MQSEEIKGEDLDLLSDVEETIFEPYMGVTKEGLVVLFTAVDTGVVLLDPEGDFEVGYFSEDWDEDEFGYYDSDKVIQLFND